MAREHLAQFLRDNGLMVDDEGDLDDVSDDLVLFVHVRYDDPALDFPTLDQWLIDRGLSTISCVATYRSRSKSPRYVEGEVYGFTEEQSSLAMLFKLTFCG